MKSFIVFCLAALVQGSYSQYLPATYSCAAPAPLVLPAPPAPCYSEAVAPALAAIAPALPVVAPALANTISASIAASLPPLLDAALPTVLTSVLTAAGPLLEAALPCSAPYAMPYGTPVSYSAPAVAYSAPPVACAAPAYSYAAPAVSYATPTCSYAAPLVPPPTYASPYCYC